MATDEPAFVSRAPFCFELYAISHMLSTILRSHFASRYRPSTAGSSQKPRFVSNHTPSAISHTPFESHAPIRACVYLFDEPSFMQ